MIIARTIEKKALKKVKTDLKKNFEEAQWLRMLRACGLSNSLIAGFKTKQRRCSLLRGYGFF